MKEYKYTINGNKYEVVVGDIKTARAGEEKASRKGCYCCSQR